jgi:hypothetical protein
MSAVVSTGCQAIVFVHADVVFHPELPLVALLVAVASRDLLAEQVDASETPLRWYLDQHMLHRWIAE